MPTIADLERLDTLVSNLKSLSGKQRGELIEADAWNRLVSAVIDIGRATIDDTSGTVGKHSHTDQVSLEWLDPKLRGIILEGGLGSPSSTAQLGKLERQLAKFSSTLQDFSDRLNRIQADVSGVATRDVERESSVGTALRKLDGVFDARDDVASLRGSLRLIEAQVRTAAELSGRLQGDDGADIDFSGLAKRIGELESLGERLTLPNGNAFDGAAYARDLQQLRAELVTEDELREALGNVETNFSGDLRDQLVDDARAAALAANADTLDALSRDLRADQAERIRTLDQSLDGRITTATGDLRNQILTDARTEQTSLLDRRLTAFGLSRDANVDQRLAAFSDDVNGRLAVLAETVRGDVAGAVSRDLAGQISAFDDRFKSVEASAANLGVQIGELTRTMNATALRIETVQRDLQAADSRLSVQLTDRIAKIETTLDDRIKTATDANRVAMRAERATELAVMRDQLTTDMTRTLRDVAKTEVAMATSQLRGEMTEIASAEIDAGLAVIRKDVQETSAVSNAQLSGLVAAEVRRATADLDQRITLAIDSRQPAITRDTTLNTNLNVRQPVIR